MGSSLPPFRGATRWWTLNLSVAPQLAQRFPSLCRIRRRTVCQRAVFSSGRLEPERVTGSVHQIQSGCGYVRKCHLARRSERLSVPLEPRRANARGALLAPPLRLAADSVSVAIEAVWIRIRHIPANPEPSMADLAAVEVRGRRRNANVGVGSSA